MASRAAYINVGGVDSVGAVTITAPDQLTVVGHSLANGDLVAVDTITGGAVGPLEEGVTYFVRDVSGDDFKLSGSRGGNPIEFDSGGTAAVYVAVPGYSAEELRQIASHGKFHGSPNRLGARQGIRPGAGAPVTVAGTQWTVQNHTGTVEPAETSTQGPYDYVQLSTTGSLDPADGTNDRIDGIDLQILDDDADASGFRRSQVVYVAGTPAGTPAAPTVTARSLRLGTILVPSGGSPDPTVQSVAQPTVSSGAVLPVLTAAQLPTAGRYEGMYADQADTDALLRWDGSAWVPVGNSKGFTYWKTIRLTSSGSFVKADHPGARMVRVKLVGGGGAGAGCQTTVADDSSSSGGGGGGCYAESELLVASLASSVTVTVGAGAVSVAGTNGATGGNSSFGSLVIGPGGTGGFQLGPSDNPRATSGASSTGGGTGDLVIPGSGGSGSVTFFVPDIVVEYGHYGHGGGSHLGAATRGARGPSTAPENGALYGGGGSGVVNGPNTAGRPGGDGAQGIVIIEVYV